MVELTRALEAELHRIYEQSGRSACAIRLGRRPDGLLGLDVDNKRDDDLLIVVDQPRGLVAVIARDLAEELGDAIVHFRDSEDDRYGEPGLVLLQHRAGASRSEWTPEAAPASSAQRSTWSGLRRRFGAHQPGSATRPVGP